MKEKNVLSNSSGGGVGLKLIRKNIENTQKTNSKEMTSAFSDL